ncbi:hypothetical protein A5658_00130 [Mycobacterium sp. 1245111.1]|uniref:hypothetical protein n=1 Tax=Mycobacterium sp. 1245111.1 TaxID=1834073 RepID=UPI0007FDD546|nr:hypothetical protein [Mycobacterium sp. 1245111.1]OBK41968.1 hypothetical protein A5658_00130 [Mycobacterium sp. 1245111.1]
MSDVPHRATGGEVELGTLLALLHGTDDRYQTVQATYRTWRHEQRLHEAFRANTEDQKRRGVSFAAVAAVGSSGEPAPPETEETVRIWREGQRFREELHGGRRDGYYGVADGPRWWFWDEQMGAMSNQDNPSAQSAVGQRLQVMLNPIPLLSSLRFRVTGNSQVAGRAAMTAHATARPHDPRRGGFGFELHELGIGAQHYQLEVDQDRGVLLAVTAFRDEQPFHKITTLAIRFDEPIEPEIFQFTPPGGEQIQLSQTRPRPQHITVTEAQQRAPFTVFVPDRVPEGWQLRCMFIEASTRPPSPAQVALSYRSMDGHQSISISQVAASDRASHFGSMINDEDWHAVVHDGTSIKLSPAEWPQAQANLERDGTLVFLTSNNLTSEQLATTAAGLKPAPSTSI